MLDMKRTALLTALALVIAAPAHAEDESPFSGSLDFVSDYAFRGISQTNEDPALQLGVEYGFESGLYVGSWASNVDFVDGDGADFELDIYLGWGTDLTENVAFDVQLLRYIYPGTSSGVDYDYNELIGSVTFSEAVTFTLGYSNDVFASDETGIYYAVSGSYGLPWWELSLDLSLGYYDLDDTVGDSYTDYSIGVSREFGAVTAGLTYIDTSDSDVLEDFFGANNENRVVFSLGYGF
ncbi:MAG: TorF family putative porin [Lysobacterales bacterium]